MICPDCGLPMSMSYENADENNPGVWYCDGPNADTDQAGCFKTVPIAREIAEVVLDGIHRKNAKEETL